MGACCAGVSLGSMNRRRTYWAGWVKEAFVRNPQSNRPVGYPRRVFLFTEESPMPKKFIAVAGAAVGLMLATAGAAAASQSAPADDSGAFNNPPLSFLGD